MNILIIKDYIYTINEVVKRIKILGFIGNIEKISNEHCSIKLIGFSEKAEIKIENKTLYITCENAVIVKEIHTLLTY